MHGKILYERRRASDNFVITTGSSSQIIGYYDARGVPYLASSNGALIEVVADLITGNILEYDPSENTKTLIENAFKSREITSCPSSSHRTLINALQKKNYSTVHILTDEALSREQADEIERVCKKHSINQKIRAELSYCFKELKNVKKGNKIAIILCQNFQQMDIYLFQILDEEYYFLNRQHGLTLQECQLKAQGESVRNVFIFSPPLYEPSLLDFGNEIEAEVKIVTDIQNIGLDGALDMGINLKNLVNNKVLKSLFDVTGSGRSSRGASDTSNSAELSSPPPAEGADVHENDESSQVRMLFRDGFCAVEIQKRGCIQRIPDSLG